MDNLYTRSIEIILNNQHASGAYIASPNFDTYQYCWFRDGAFIAYAMDLVGEHSSAARFHDWAANTVNKRADVVERTIAKIRHGKTLGVNEILHTRYTVDGQEAYEKWPNFQLDGFGTWLWAVSEHQRLNRTELPGSWLQATQLVANYLTALWKFPCYDCWEEFPDQVHPHTLAAIYAGLNANNRFNQIEFNQTMVEIREFLLNNAIMNGHYVKFIGTSEVDASLLGLATPYRIVNPDDPIMQATVEKIETELRQGGGLHRYAKDTYYGGGEWILLTAWLGWYYKQVGELQKVEDLKSWVEAQADSQGFLAEQIPIHLNDESYYQPWRDRWGEIAKPLLWSHAKYLILSCVDPNQT